jgi:hypothetical protein
METGFVVTGRQGEWRAIDVYLIASEPFQAEVGSAGVVQLQVADE